MGRLLRHYADLCYMFGCSPRYTYLGQCLLPNGGISGLYHATSSCMYAMDCEG